MIDEKQLARTEAIILSMTPEEKKESEADEFKPQGQNRKRAPAWISL